MIDKNSFKIKLEASFLANSLSDFAEESFADTLYSLTCRMLDVNSYMNLTAITDIDGIILKHYVDSLTISPYIKHGAKVIDVGCGAGFPSLILAAARPDITVVALDSTAKRINYICETAEYLGIANITCVTARAEELGCDPVHREKYDVSCARAVARLNVLCELCMPFVKSGGNFIAMKANADDELSEASNAITKLGGSLIKADYLNLISESGDDYPRCIVNIEKITHTPSLYPRNNSQIKKKPL